MHCTGKRDYPVVPLRSLLIAKRFRFTPADKDNGVNFQLKQPLMKDEAKCMCTETP